MTTDAFNVNADSIWPQKETVSHLLPAASDTKREYAKIVWSITSWKEELARLKDVSNISEIIVENVQINTIW